MSDRTINYRQRLNELGNHHTQKRTAGTTEETNELLNLLTRIIIDMLDILEMMD